MAKKKKTKRRLPNKLIGIPCSDKHFHEKWYEGRNMLNFPHPYRACLIGRPNTGKTTTVKNIILRAHPQFQEVYVIHCDANYTTEYDDVGAIMLSEIPPPEQWDGQVKTLVILDDIEFKFLPKEQKRNLDRLWGFVSTHKNISCMLCVQDCFNVPPAVRRMSNLFIFWKIVDIDSMAMAARKTGLKKDNFHSIFNDLMNEKRDSLWIDMTDDTKYPMRKNGFELIEKVDNECAKQFIADC